MPGVGHHPAAGCELVSPGVDGTVEAAAGGELPLGLGGQVPARPRGVRLGIGVRDMGHWMRPAGPAAGARSLRAPPARARHVGPPVAVVAQVNGVLGGLEDQRSRHQQIRVGVRVVRGDERPLGDGHVPGRRHEALELLHRHGLAVHPEPVHGDPVHGPLFGIEVG